MVEEWLKEEAEEEEAEEEEAARLTSERDGDLTDASSAGESVPGASCLVKSVELADLQGPDKCRQTHVGTLADGSKAQLCCGCTMTECQQRA